MCCRHQNGGSADGRWTECSCFTSSQSCSVSSRCTHSPAHTANTLAALLAGTELSSPVSQVTALTARLPSEAAVRCQPR